MTKQYTLQEYEIWSDAFGGQELEGRPSYPEFMGKEKGRDFKDACIRFFCKLEIKDREKYDKEDQYFDTGRVDYDPSRNKYWGLRLFPSKKEAENEA